MAAPDADRRAIAAAWCKGDPCPQPATDAAGLAVDDGYTPPPTAAEARADWLAWRRHGIGASDIAAIVGISPWASPWSVWADKLDLLPDEPETEVMEAGRWLEAAIGPWFEHRTGLRVAGQQQRCQHRSDPIARCTVDGLVYDRPPLAPLNGAEPISPLEIKVTGPGRRWDEIPEHYQAQGQWQMHVTDRDRVFFAVLMGRRLDVHELTRDQGDIDYLAERAAAFWDDHVVPGDPPPIDDHDATARALAAVYPTATPGTAVDVDHIAGRLTDWAAAKESVKHAKALVDGAANEIKAALGDAEEGTVAGQRAVSWRSQTRTTRCPGGCGHESTTEFRVLRAHKAKGADHVEHP